MEKSEAIKIAMKNIDPESKLYSKLNEVYIEQLGIDTGETIALKWTVKDVLYQDASLTKAQCIDVLGRVESYHNCETGVSWNNLRTEIEAVKGS